MNLFVKRRREAEIASRMVVETIAGELDSAACGQRQKEEARVGDLAGQIWQAVARPHTAFTITASSARGHFTIAGSL